MVRVLDSGLCFLRNERRYLFCARTRAEHAAAGFSGVSDFMTGA